MSQADLKRIDEHLTWVHDVARSLSTHPSVSERDQSSDGPDMGAWMTTFQAAKASGRILWADDVGLRVLAHNEGVLVFGTDSLLRALAALGKLTNDELDSSIDLLRNEYGVDFPLAPAWAIETAQRDNWRAGPATLVFARASTWMELTRALQLWQEIVNCAGHDDPAAVPIWVRAASLGIAAAVDPPTARDLLAGIIIAAASAVDSDPATFAACVLAAQASCDEEQIPDPLESALKRMLDVIAEQVDPAAAASAVARLGSELSDGNRELLRELLFDL